MITGYRRYDIRGGVLVGATNTAWNERELTAQCKLGEGYNRSPKQNTLKYREAVCALHLEHDVECSCGIYVARDDYIEGYGGLPVLAAITGWGAYIEFEYGWRIQHARIEHMWIDATRIAVDPVALQAKYGVPVEAKSNVSSWVSAPQYQPNYKVTPQTCPKCNNTHDLSPWTPKGKRPLFVCEMETSHVANAKAYLENLSNLGMRVPWHAKWIKIFSDELTRRPPLPKIDPKGNVSW